MGWKPQKAVNTKEGSSVQWSGMTTCGKLPGCIVVALLLFGSADAQSIPVRTVSTLRLAEALQGLPGLESSPAAAFVSPWPSDSSNGDLPQVVPDFRFSPLSAEDSQELRTPADGSGHAGYSEDDDYRVTDTFVPNTPGEEVHEAGTLDLSRSTRLLTQPWWSQSQPSHLRDGSAAQSWELDQLICLAVEHSPFVQSVLIQPQILQAQAEATNGEFDPSAFVESIFNDTSDPVGNTLITGSANRLNEHLWNNSSGIRNKNTLGGQAELAQDFNFQDNNSEFFIPANQADTRLVMRYTQPLMRGAGVAYNRASFFVASLAANQSLHEASLQIQDHVLAITNSYWELVAARAIARQTLRGLESLEKLRTQLSGREDLDSLKSQLLRADAAIARQVANRARALAQVQAAEARLRAAVAAPQLRTDRESELIPISQSNDWPSQISLAEELTTALNYHPEVLAIRESLKAARIRLQVAENELRPTLNLVMEGYVRGLNGSFDAAKSFGDQFSEGAPSYSAGVSYLRPYRNTAAKAILRERRLELRKSLLELDQTLLTIGADVEAAAAQVTATFSELESTVRATLATHAELQYLEARWQNAFLDGTQQSLLLDQLLNAEIQLISAENSWARAQADHMLALAALRRATGSILPMLSLSQYRAKRSSHWNSSRSGAS